jgi:hypothetical protein
MVYTTRSQDEDVDRRLEMSLCVRTTLYFKLSRPFEPILSTKPSHHLGRLGRLTKTSRRRRMPLADGAPSPSVSSHDPETLEAGS